MRGQLKLLKPHRQVLRALTKQAGKWLTRQEIAALIEKLGDRLVDHRVSKETKTYDQLEDADYIEVDKGGRATYRITTKGHKALAAADASAAAKNAMKAGSNGRLPRAVARKILKRAAEGEPAMVVICRDGRPSRVFGLEEYRKMQELPRKVKPWEHRRALNELPEPLRSPQNQRPTDALPKVKAGIVMPLKRQHYYE